MAPLGAEGGAGDSHTASAVFSIEMPAGWAGASPSNRIAKANVTAKRPQYVSVNTGSVTFKLPYMSSSDVVPLSASSPDCSDSTGTWVCAANFVADVGNDQALTIETFASNDGTGAALSENTVDISVCSCPATKNAVTVTLNGIAYALVLALSPSSVTSGIASNVTATWAALDSSGATIVGPGTIVDQDGNPVAPQLADSDTTGDTSIGTYNSTTDSWPIIYNGGNISSPTFTLSAPGNAGLSPVTQALTVATGLTVETTTDTTLTAGVEGIGYPSYQPTPPPITVSCSPAICSAFPGAYIYGAENQALWVIQPDAWNVNDNASGSSSAEYTGSGSIVEAVDFTGLTANVDINGGPVIEYGQDIYGDPPALGQGLTFPVELSSLHALNADVAYNLSNTITPGNQDVIFDEWLTPTSTYSGGNGGAVEVEVFLYMDSDVGTTLVGTIVVPETVNGTTKNVTWDEYWNEEAPGNTPNVVFVPEGWSYHEPIGVTSGEVELNLLPFLLAAAQAVPDVGSSWYLPGMIVGSEYGTSTGGTSIDFAITYTKLVYQEVFYAQ